MAGEREGQIEESHRGEVENSDGAECVGTQIEGPEEADLRADASVMRPRCNRSWLTKTAYPIVGDEVRDDVAGYAQEGEDESRQERNGQQNRRNVRSSRNDEGVSAR